MNASRRKSLKSIAEGISALQAELEAVRDEEQEAFDNMPQSLQDGEKGSSMQDGISNLDDAISSLESCTDSLSEMANA